MKNVERAREIRLWIKQVIIPIAATLLVVDYKYPDLKKKIFKNNRDENNVINGGDKYEK